MQPIIDAAESVDSEAPLDAGELNYLFTRFCLMTHPKRYSDYNALVGALECCKLEMYRRAVGSYGDSKIASPENGDIPGYGGKA